MNQSWGQEQGSRSNHQHQASGFVIVDLMDLCDAEGFSITLLWDETLAGLQTLLSRPEKGRGPGLSWDSTSHKTTLVFFCSLIQATTSSFIPAEGQPLQRPRLLWSEICCTSLLSLLPAAYRQWLGLLYSCLFSRPSCWGGGKAMWGILIKACLAWRVLAGRQRNRGLTLALFVILSSIAHTEGVTSIHDDTW